jgi:hypothetical protein
VRLLSSAYPHQALFRAVTTTLTSARSPSLAAPVLCESGETGSVFTPGAITSDTRKNLHSWPQTIPPFQPNTNLSVNYPGQMNENAGAVLHRAGTLTRPLQDGVD